MAGPKVDPEMLAHLEWLGFVKPTGLVVSAPALVRAGAILDRRDVEGQRLLRACVTERTFSGNEGSVPYLPDFRWFAQIVLGWGFSPKGYAGTTECPIPVELEVPLPDYGETLRPDFGVREIEPKDGASPWQLLVRVLGTGDDFDRVERGHGRLEASAHGRMERLLRQTGVPAGLLFNGRALRLISAPRGESSGWLDFSVGDMVQTAGRPISTALRLLLGQERLLSLPRAQRLGALLEDSRRFQNEVSEKLSEQVLHALYELLRGFQAAHDASKGELLRKPLDDYPDDVYRGLLTVILRLVFLLYAEERDMLPEDETFLRYYSLAGLYERLREDAALFPDTMDQRYGAWAQLLVLFRMIYDGAEAGAMHLPKRHGVLFDPNRFKFLEGRESGAANQERIDAPLVPDGTIYRALEKLLVLDGERISYRALDVEQIGSVYETMMGFRLETATGPSAAIRSDKKQGAPTAVGLQALLAEPPSSREKWVRDRTDRTLTDSLKKLVAAAKTIEDLHAALLPVIDLAATPDLVPKGAMVLQPSEERRRSGSHYTPRALTEPIVRTTLEPILVRLKGVDGRPTKPAQILELKVCDPAMGSGAFLVETCRQLGDALVEAWRAHGEMPVIPADEDEVIFARRLIAQRCVYGVDRNQVAVDLAKMSLWLATLAKEHALTFVDHALRHGDSLVGLSRRQIEALNWDHSKPILKGLGVSEALEKFRDLRKLIREADEGVSDSELRRLWDEAQTTLRTVRLFGDLVIAAFFEGEKSKDREAKRVEYASAVVGGDAEEFRARVEKWRHAELPLVPFHWEIELPEVFERENPGFDLIVGNPPFAGKNTVASGNVRHYPNWLQELHEESHGNADLVAHFFRRGFELIRHSGAFGLIATNTIAQGDTRATGLRWICKHGGEIYSATKRVKWPGLAAVVVSVLHVMKGRFNGVKRLDGREVQTITAFLFHRGSHDDPARLAASAGKSFIGSYVLGMGFTFDDTDKKGIATPLAEMDQLITKDPRNQDRIFPFISGEEINDSPTYQTRRFVINFEDWPLRRADLQQKWSTAAVTAREQWLRSGIVPLDYPYRVAADFPDLLSIVESKVKGSRASHSTAPWWQFERPRVDLYKAIEGLPRFLVNALYGTHLSFAFLTPPVVFANKVCVLPFSQYDKFAILQSRIHELWARFFSATLKDDLAYAPSDCFETFPFPEGRQTFTALEAAGKDYYEFRAAFMVRNDEGLTKTYNSFHDPNESDPDILKLRELHSAMDYVVLGAYGWNDISTNCDFFLDYEIDEEEWGDRKKPYRYRWPDEVRDEVLARLIELNSERAREEARSGGAAIAKRSEKKVVVKRAQKVTETKDLFS